MVKRSRHTEAIQALNALDDSQREALEAHVEAERAAARRQGRAQVYTVARIVSAGLGLAAWGVSFHAIAQSSTRIASVADAWAVVALFFLAGCLPMLCVAASMLWFSDVDGS